MSRILLKDNVTLCREDGSSVKFHIKAHIGSGASCVVYHAVCEDKTEHLLKEYYPRNLDLERNDDGVLVVPEHKREIFDKGLQRFRNGNERQKEIRLLEHLKNSTSNIQGYFYGNGTEYIDMTVFSGQTYKHIESETLHSLMLRMRELAQAIGNYHNAGFLHLDIKPENIFILDEDQSVKGIMLFDFDSVIEKSNKMSIPALSYTKDWAAPEQLLSYKRGSICEATDLFSIGEIIFTKIFGRHSTQAERRSFAEYDIDHKAPIFENVNPKVVPLIKELFRHTLCAVPARRYQTANALIEQLNSIIAILSSTEPYLISNIELERIYTVKPAKSLITIHEKLQSTGRHFNKSTPKRNLSKYVMEYITRFGNYYDSVLMLDCNNGFIDAFLDISIVNFETDASKSTYEQVLQVFNVLERVCDNKVLIVLDNFDERYLVDPRFASRIYHCDIQQVYDICLRLQFLNASVLINGAFDIAHLYKKEHYRHLHELLYNLAKKCYHKRQYALAKEYIKKAVPIAYGCSANYVKEYEQKDKELLMSIQVDFELSVGYGVDADEIELDSFLEQFDDCMDD